MSDPLRRSDEHGMTIPEIIEKRLRDYDVRMLPVYEEMQREGMAFTGVDAELLDRMRDRVRNSDTSRSVPVTVRLTPEEVAAVEALADTAGLPVSTLLRTWVLARIRDDDH